MQTDDRPEDTYHIDQGHGFEHFLCVIAHEVDDFPTGCVAVAVHIDTSESHRLSENNRHDTASNAHLHGTS